MKQEWRKGCKAICTFRCKSTGQNPSFGNVDFFSGSFFHISGVFFFSFSCFLFRLRIINFISAIITTLIIIIIMFITSFKIITITINIIIIMFITYVYYLCLVFFMIIAVTIITIIITINIIILTTVIITNTHYTTNKTNKYTRESNTPPHIHKKYIYINISPGSHIASRHYIRVTLQSRDESPFNRVGWGGRGVGVTKGGERVKGGGE